MCGSNCCSSGGRVATARATTQPPSAVRLAGQLTTAETLQGAGVLRCRWIPSESLSFDPSGEIVVAQNAPLTLDFLATTTGSPPTSTDCYTASSPAWTWWPSQDHRC